jgi:hypothetical protein
LTTVSEIDGRVLERVRKLLARAEHPATPVAEAEACSAKAAALMSRHVIDEALLDATRADRSAPVVREVVVEPPYAMAKAVLLSSVAAAFRSCVAIGGDRGSAGRRCTVVGFDGDLRATELLFTSLLLQASTAMLAASPADAGVRAFRRAFLLGYAATVGARLRDVRGDVEQEATTAAPGTAVVLADRHAQVQAAFSEQFPRLRTVRSTVSSASGVFAGQAAGLRADLSMSQQVDGGRGQLGA